MVIRSWKHSPQLDWACQSCGTPLRTRPRWARIVVGVMVLPWLLVCAPMGATLSFLDGGHWRTLVLGLAVGALGLVAAPLVAAPFLTVARSPIVPGADLPPMRFDGAEPGRRCSCGETATCIGVHEGRVKGIKAGTLRAYACEACGRQFDVDDGLGMATSFLAGTAFLVIAVSGLLLGAVGSWLAVLGLLGAGALGLASTTVAVWRFANLVRHPVVPLPGPGP